MLHPKKLNYQIENAEKDIHRAKKKDRVWVNCVTDVESNIQEGRPKQPGHLTRRDKEASIKKALILEAEGENKRAAEEKMTAHD